MASSLFFNGRQTYSPSTQSQVDDSAMSPKSLTIGNVMVIVGAAAGGKPNTPIFFGDPAEVDPILVAGPLRHACKKAFAPSDETNAPSTVIALRIGTSTPATLNLVDTAGQVAVAVTSTQYGASANATRIRADAGSTGGYRLSVQSGQTYFTQDNLARNALSVSYAGAGATATVTVSNTQVILTVAGVAPAVIPLATCPTVAQLVDRIAAVPGFIASVLSGAGNTPALNGLDALSAVDCKTAPVTVTANLQVAVEWLTGLAQGFVTAVRGAQSGAPLVTGTGYTFLSGGTDPATTIMDWATALGALQAIDCQWIAACSGDPAVHALIDAHVQYMSTVGRRERRAILGPNAGTSMAAVQALPLAINSDRTSIVWPGHYDYDDDTGALTLFAPWMSAVIVAAMFAGADPGTPMTNKTMTVRGLEVVVRNPTDTDQLIPAGVLVLEQTTKGFKVVRSISTWLVNDKFNRVEQSCGAANDYAVRQVREKVDELRGQESNPLVLTLAIEVTDSILTELAKPKPVGPGILVGDANSPAFKDIRATLVGDRLDVVWQQSPVVPLNFITNTVSTVPYSGTASA